MNGLRYINNNRNAIMRGPGWDNMLANNAGIEAVFKGLQALQNGAGAIRQAGNDNKVSQALLGTDGSPEAVRQVFADNMAANTANAPTGFFGGLINSFNPAGKFTGQPTGLNMLLKGSLADSTVGASEMRRRNQNYELANKADKRAEDNAAFNRDMQTKRYDLNKNNSDFDREMTRKQFDENQKQRGIDNKYRQNQFEDSKKLNEAKRKHLENVSDSDNSTYKDLNAIAKGMDVLSSQLKALTDPTTYTVIEGKADEYKALRSEYMTLSREYISLIKNLRGANNSENGNSSGYVDQQAVDDNAVMLNLDKKFKK